MEFELFFLYNGSCPNCGSSAVVAMHEQCVSKNTGNVYSAHCGHLCLECSWSKEASGRQSFPMYTGKNCYPEWVDLNDDRWDYDAANLIMQMKHCDGDMNVAAELRRLARQHQQNAAQRKKQEADARAERLKEEARKRQAEEAHRKILQQQEEEARKRAELERKRLAAQSATAAAHVERGRAALKSGDLQTALNEFNKARSLYDTYDLNALIAETLASASNADQHAGTIINELQEYFSYLDSQGMTPTIQQYLWMARAYLARNDRSQACDYYFLAGNIAYDADDFVSADRIYCESLEKTNFYQSRYLFRLAYAHSNANAPLSEDDHRFCIDYYTRSIRENGGDDYARGNLTFHYNALKEYHNSIEWGLPSAQRGNVTFFYNNLANAYYRLGKYSDALQWYKAAEAAGLERQDYKIACCLEELGEYDDARDEFKDLLYSHYDEEDIYEHLLNIAEEDNFDDDEIAEYRIKLLELNPYRYEIEEWLRDAVDKEQENVIEDMLYHKPDLRESLFEYVLETAWYRFDSDEDIAKWRIELLKINSDRYEREEWLHEAVDKELEDAVSEMLDLMPEMRENLFEYVLETADSRGDSDNDIMKWRIELLKINPDRYEGRKWLVDAVDKDREDIVDEILAVAPQLKEEYLEYLLQTADDRGASYYEIERWRVELLKIDPNRYEREYWFSEAKERNSANIVREMLALMPDIRQREEEEARIAKQREEEEARIAKQREEEELLLLLMM